MSLTRSSQKTITESSGRKFTNERISESVTQAATEGYFEEEFYLLNRVISRVNKLLVIADLNRDPDLKSVYDQRHPFGPLPEMFSWNSEQEMFSWTRTLLRTFNAINNDIGPFYSDPAKNPNLNTQDVFRWFLLDGYCRWYAVSQTNQAPERLEEERLRAEIICFALCEAAVTIAEEGDGFMTELVRWFLRNGWINTGEQYNLTPELVERAKKIIS